MCKSSVPLLGILLLLGTCLGHCRGPFSVACNPFALGLLFILVGDVGTRDLSRNIIVVHIVQRKSRGNACLVLRIKYVN